ncbi:MAG: NAD-dependent epimerase/dehydratase family protein [Hyphomicrobiales bacterium]|nr:NAD-dependent epimerase/dehydratase family protein [Hyphomicrobiales bacterium]
MGEHVLITGGAGFIGRHLSQNLLARGHDVRVLDCLVEQVHGTEAKPPESDGVELVVGDVRDPHVLRRALAGIDSVVHLAAEVGVGQSMYAIERYVSVNDLGTAVLLEALAKKPVRRVVVASSMSIYGEGLYRDADGKLVEDATRKQAVSLSWDPVDDLGRPLRPIPTPEWKRPSLASVYALTKYAQERMTIAVAPAYGMEAVALRLFNVYGPGQALSNPYTGVLAIFASRLANGKPPLLFEDGRQRRDFVHVKDVAEAFALALETGAAKGEVYNIGSGQDRSVVDIAEALATAMGRPSIAPEIVGKARTGDIRHCFADTAKAARELGFLARQDFTEGLARLSEWVAGQRAHDRIGEARRELEIRGLVA